MKIKRYNISPGDISTVRKVIARDTGDFTKEEEIVKGILSDIRQKGDSALFSYMEKFDGAKLDHNSVKVTEDEIQKAVESVDSELLLAMKHSMENIRSYHEKELSGGFMDERDGIRLGQRVLPLERVGIYVPGGKAAYPSTVLMDAIPAIVAGVEHIIMATPPGKDGKVNPVILAAASIAGVKDIYKIGGAQAVGAMAYGTESIPKVDKIVGPGNIFVALAKRLVFGEVSIDSVAGPSEVTVLADAKANPRFVAADLMSQAEHDEMAQSILVTDSEDFANQVEAMINEMVPGLQRAPIMEKSFADNGRIFICPDMNLACQVVNEIAPEHLEIQTEDPERHMALIKNAGAIFLGAYSSEPLGDYFAGPDHVLPTNGTARFFSPLSTDSFIKKTSVIYYSKEKLLESADEIIRFADSEGLTAHANSIEVRK